MSKRPRDWMFLNKQALVLIYIERHPNAKVSDIARALWITERSVHNLLNDLTSEGYLRVERHGRGNWYTANKAAHLRHELLRDRTLGELLSLADRVVRA